MSAAFVHLFNTEGGNLVGTPDGENYPWGKQSEAALNSNVPEEALLGDEARWWERARQLGVLGEEAAAEWYRKMGYEVYDGLIIVDTAQGRRFPDLAVRLPGERWAFVEVKANLSPLVPSQIRKDRLIESVGYVGRAGPEETIGRQPATPVTLVRVLIP